MATTADYIELLDADKNRIRLKAPDPGDGVRSQGVTLDGGIGEGDAFIGTVGVNSRPRIVADKDAISSVPLIDRVAVSVFSDLLQRDVPVLCEVFTVWKECAANATTELAPADTTYALRIVEAWVHNGATAGSAHFRRGGSGSSVSAGTAMGPTVPLGSYGGDGFPKYANDTAANERIALSVASGGSTVACGIRYIKVPTEVPGE